MNTVSEKRRMGLGLMTRLVLGVTRLDPRDNPSLNSLGREMQLSRAIVYTQGKCRRPELPGDDRQPWMSARLGNKKGSFKSIGHRNRHAGY